MMETETHTETLGTESILTQLVAQKIPACQNVSCPFISQFSFDIQSSLSILREREIEDVILEEE